MSKIKKEAADVVNEEVFSSTIRVLCLSLSSCNSQLKHALYVNWEAGSEYWGQCYSERALHKIRQRLVFSPYICFFFH